MNQLTKMFWHLMLPHLPQTNWAKKIQIYPESGYYLLQSKDCIMETCMLFIVVRSMSIGDRSKSHEGWS